MVCDMIDQVKNFIEENIDLIEENKWDEIYQEADNKLGDETGKFTEIMLQADIHPEEYLKELPKNFLYKSSIQEFEIPNIIKSIGRNSFFGCRSLTSIIIPGTVASIDGTAFYGCDNLKSISIPDSVINIGGYAFGYCKSLTSVTIGNSVTKIGFAAFGSCSSLTSIIIKNPEIIFGDNVFEYCNNHLDIQFIGTKEQWKNIAKDKFSGVTYTCTCIDGIIKKIEVDL